MAKPTWNAGDQNAVLTTYTQNYLSRTLMNQDFESHPILDDLRSAKATYDGGVNMVLPILDGYTPNGGPITRGGTVTPTFTDHATAARYAPVFYEETLYIDWTDEVQAMGAGATLKFATDAVDAGLLRIQEKLATDLCAASTATNGINSLLALIDSTGSIGGINPATGGQEFWAAHEDSSVGSFTTNGAAALRTAFLATGKYKMLGRVNKIYASVTAYKAYQASGISLSTINYAPTGAAGRTTDIGTGMLNYEGIPVVYESHLDALEGSLSGVMLGVNTKAIKLAEKPNAQFTLGPWVDMLPGGLLGRAAVLKWAGNCVMQARSPNFKLAGITA